MNTSSNHFLPRALDTRLHTMLQFAGAVVIEGPRGCGKTTTGAAAAASAIYLDQQAARILAANSPASVLAGAAPRLIDEWQLEPWVWNEVRHEVDRSQQKGRFILTGSAVPADDITRHSGAGRFARLRHRTLTWFERGLGRPEHTVSLTGLFAGERPEPGPEGCTYEQMCTRLVHGGFPGMLGAPTEFAAEFLRAYLEETTRTDLQRIAEIRHTPTVLRALLHSLARATAGATTYSTIAADLQSVAPGIIPRTVASYCQALERVFVLEPQPPWMPKLRSRARLRRNPKLHLADPGLALAALGAGVQHLLDDPETAGLMFESQAVHDLRVFAEALGGEVLHYQDSNGHEIDAVLVLPDGRWGAIEVKVSGAQVGAALKSLAAATSHIHGQPAFRLVLTALGPTFSTSDGVVTCPLEALVP